MIAKPRHNISGGFHSVGCTYSSSGETRRTVDQVSKLDSYPVLKTEDFLATLGGGNKFHQAGYVTGIPTVIIG